MVNRIESHGIVEMSKHWVVQVVGTMMFAASLALLVGLVWLMIIWVT